MFISESWLREWANPDLDRDQLCERLTLAGLEIGTVLPAGPTLNKVVVGTILTTASHPNADRLKLCKVDVGDAEPLDIVCGAPNARAELRVAVAQVGAKLPGGLKIKKSKIRGEVSLGMLCSSQELELDQESDGILELPEDAAVGLSLSEYLDLTDYILEVELTPNRGDCLSARGLGRDLAAISGAEFSGLPTTVINAQIDEAPVINLANAESCPRYVGRLIRGVNAAAPTPMWIRERLRRSGIRSLSLLVDIANYVMLELGQPMHAFDLTKINGPIQVRMAVDGESLILLNGEEQNLTNRLLVIADDQGPIAAAGIMGGLDSAVSDETTDILLESAWFTPSVIAGRAREMGLHTEASHRFERGVDPTIQLEAIERASELIVALAGGQCGPCIDQQSPAHPPKAETIKLQPALISKRLGLDVSEKKINDIFDLLGMTTTISDQHWEVTPPPWRFDISIPEDMVEEVARVIGYDAIPAVLPTLDTTMLPVDDDETGTDRLADKMVDRGYQEAITYSFVSPELQQLFAPDQPNIELLNPLSTEMSVMRSSLWPGLIQALQFNQHRQHSRIRLFEQGQIFKSNGKDLLQPTVISAIITGSRHPESWHKIEQPVDFYDLKGDLEYLLEATGRSADFSLASGQHPALHPGRSARVVNAEKAVGWIGELHPQIAGELQLSGRIYLFELMLEPLMRRKVPAYTGVSKFPSVRRDLALLVSHDITAGQIETTIRAAVGGSLQNFRVFDVYRGSELPPGKKSVAIGLDIGDYSKTLTDTEIDEIIAVVLQNLHDQLGADLRE
ncbi:MAG: phenylalanine--tRNA ligase subunit beta [Gammaproteobacteria bacterium]|nr:MAG: phenylalanine--tRNA ligase subunit beta [Gammaproteobacteria bacterium]